MKYHQKPFSSLRNSYEVATALLVFNLVSYAGEEVVYGSSKSAIPEMGSGAKSGFAEAKDFELTPLVQNRNPGRWSDRFEYFSGLKTRFSGFGRFVSPFADQPLGGGQPYRYDGGFVLPDASGNADCLTSFWSYQSDGQYDPCGSGSLDFYLSIGLESGSESLSEQSDYGLDLHWERDLGSLDRLLSGKSNSRWGGRASFSYLNFDNSSSNRLFSGVSRTTDRFELNRVVPPLAPFAGSLSGPNALISDSPSRTVSLLADGAFINGKRELDVDLFSAGFGLYVDYEISPRSLIRAEVGLTFGLANGDYEFTSAITIPGEGTQTFEGSEPDTFLLFSGYLGLNVSFLMDEDWTANDSKNTSLPRISNSMPMAQRRNWISQARPC